MTVNKPPLVFNNPDVEVEQPAKELALKGNWNRR